MNNDKWKYLTARFIALYVLLGAVALASIAGAVAFSQVQVVRHDVGTVKASLGDTNLGRVATEYVKRIAGAQGYSVQRLTVVKVVEGKDSALVTARVTLADPTGQTQTVNLVVTLHRGVWSAINAAAA